MKASWRNVRRDAIREADYREWDRPPGYEKRQSSNAPHGNKVDLYVNEPFTEALSSADVQSEWPVGAIVVKDGFDEGDLDLIAVMKKTEEGWFYAEYDDEGDAIYSGKPSLCVDCHRSGDDSIRAFDLPTVRQ